MMLDLGQFCTGYVGGWDARTQVRAEPPLGYHAGLAGVLTWVVILFRDSVW